jgi:Rha family phage regulatory protein
MADSSIGSSATSLPARPELSVDHGTVTTTSLQIAEHFGKRHADVIRAIKRLDAPAEFTERNFALSDFTDSTGRTLPAYRITRDGFTLLAMGFTGKEAQRWKVAYIDAFNRMEAALHQPADTQRMELAFLWPQRPRRRCTARCSMR